MIKLVEYVKGQPLRFREESRGTHGSEHYLTLSALDGPTVVGKVDYSVYQDDVSIEMIRTNDDEKRKGVATELAKELQRVYPNHEIIWGTTTGEGHQFLKALPRTFVRNEKYDELEGRLKALQKRLAQLQKVYDDWSTLHDTNKEKAIQLRPSILKLNDTFNSVSDNIWTIEQQLRDLKPGKWKIHT